MVNGEDENVKKKTSKEERRSYNSIIKRRIELMLISLIYIYY